MKYKVSVIIPCYNAEDTIKRSINSVIKQTLGFENIELLLYDDASLDNTPDIIQEFSDEYENIIPVLSKNNSGKPSKGRNVCIEKASSDFVMFMDNDDEYDKDICMRLYNEITDSNSDLVTCSFINKDGLGDIKEISDYLFEKAIVDGDKLIFEKQNLFYLDNTYVWNSIFKKEIIINNKIKFPENEFAEDVSFSIDYKLHISKLIYLKDYFGVYRYVRNDSLSNSFNLKDLIDIHEITVGLCNKLKNHNYPCKYAFKWHVPLTLVRICQSDFLDYPKIEVIGFLKELRKFEMEFDVNFSYDRVMNIINYFIRHENYNMAFFLLKQLRRAYKSKSAKRVFRLFK